jgi:hypothetical protein
MLPPNEVIAELDARGYVITPRRLIDWRQKELLPPLTKRGLGQGGGWIYVWHEPDIVEQVIAVQELLWIHERTHWLYVPLWCLGFTVPLERVRGQLLQRIERQQEFLTGDGQDPDDIADHVSGLALHEATRPGPRRSQRPVGVDALEYWFNLLSGNPAYAPDMDAWLQIALAVSNVGIPEEERSADKRDWTWSPARLRLIQRWVRRYAALPRLEKAAHHAGQAEWEAVHSDWQALARLIRTATACVEEIPETYRQIGLRAVAIAGPWISLVDLSMRWRGQGQVWDSIRSELVSMRERVERDPDMQEQMRQLWRDTTGSQESGGETIGT